MCAAILLPALLIGFGTLRTFLAVTDGLDTVASYAQLHQEILGCAGALVAKRKIVLSRSAFVAVTLHNNCEVRILREYLLQQSGIAGQRVACIRANIALVVIKERILRLLLQ